MLKIKRWKNMKYVAKIEVSLKSGHSDPEGETTKRSLRDLHYEVIEVGTMKVYLITLNADSLEQAREKIDEMCVRLLSNPVKDNYSYEILES
jgi:phosphoribosylformylglycinamidine synthase